MAYKNWRRFIVLLSLAFFFYSLFYSIFFLFLASLSVDGLIGLSIVLLFSAIYRFGGAFINRYLLSISKNIWIFFVNLITVTYLVQRLFIKIASYTKKLLAFQYLSNYYIFVELEKIFRDLNVMLLNKYISNVVLLELFFKRLIIKNLLEKNVISNEIILFSCNSLDLNVYLSNNIIGWFK